MKTYSPSLHDTDSPEKHAKKQLSLQAGEEKSLCPLCRKAQTDFENLPHFYHTNTENHPKTPQITGSPKVQN
ncbi:MAG: hypothetical protein K2P41_10345 [Lachnospiraceae bacterium]|nr:hypothetical protein [Lachnospiraceae bacterium]